MLTIEEKNALIEEIGILYKIFRRKYKKYVFSTFEEAYREYNGNS